MSNEAAIKQITKALNGLPKSFTRTKKRAIAKKGLAPMGAKAKAKAPSLSGDMKMSINYKTYRNNPGWLFVGPIVKTISLYNGLKQKVDPWYVKFIEYGFIHIAWPEKGKKRNKYKQSRLSLVRAKPFLRPAWDESKREVQSITEKLIAKAVKKYEKQVIRNGGK